MYVRLLKYFWKQLDQVFSCISSYKNFRCRLTDGYPEKLSLFEYPNDEISYLVLLAQVTSVQTEICKILVTNCLCLHTCYPTSSSALYKYISNTVLRQMIAVHDKELLMSKPCYQTSQYICSGVSFWPLSAGVVCWVSHFYPENFLRWWGVFIQR